MLTRIEIKIIKKKNTQDIGGSGEGINKGQDPLLGSDSFFFKGITPLVEILGVRRGVIIVDSSFTRKGGQSWILKNTRK